MRNHFFDKKTRDIILSDAWDKSDLIRYILKTRCKSEADYTLSWMRRFFYSIKAIICILIRKRSDHDAYTKHGVSWISAAVFNGHDVQYPEAMNYEWDELYVAREIWQYTVERGANW